MGHRPDFVAIRHYELNFVNSFHTFFTHTIEVLYKIERFTSITANLEVRLEASGPPNITPPLGGLAVFLLQCHTSESIEYGSA